MTQTVMNYLKVMKQLSVSMDDVKQTAEILEMLPRKYHARPGKKASYD